MVIFPFLLLSLYDFIEILLVVDTFITSSLVTEYFHGSMTRSEEEFTFSRGEDNDCQDFVAPLLEDWEQLYSEKGYFRLVRQKHKLLLLLYGSSVDAE